MKWLDAFVAALAKALGWRRVDEMEYLPPKPLPEAQNAPQEPGTVPVAVQVPVPSPTVPESGGLKWDTVENARHSVRVICDQMGLTVQQKNELCATVGAESGWQSYYLSGPRKGQPVKLENTDDGMVWSTDWGICQVNDYFHIGKGKSFPSVEYVLKNPETCIRWMAKQWKAGHANWWVAHSSGAYKSFL
jgi:hypothetical protein